MNGLDARFLSIEQATGMLLGGKDTGNVNDDAAYEGKSFESILSEKTAEKDNLRFSKHANARLESRNINLSEEQLGRLNQGVEKAKAKNINESLVMLDNIAFIVNIRNNTVVTAIDKSDDNVFTNIDGAVIV
jgi:flagellar operon protein